MSGRSRPDTSVDRVVVSAGRWWQAAGEIVLAAVVGREVRPVRRRHDQGLSGLPAGDTGAKGTVLPTTGPPGGAGPDLPTKTLTIVGIAGSISTPEMYGWMSPTDIAALAPGGQVPAQQMLYG